MDVWECVCLEKEKRKRERRFGGLNTLGSRREGVNAINNHSKLDTLAGEATLPLRDSIHYKYLLLAVNMHE